jgi:hypothetical protein
MTKSVTNNIIFLCHVDICLDIMLGSDGTCQRLGTFCLDASKPGHGGQSTTTSSTTSLLLLHTFWPIHIVQGLTYGMQPKVELSLSYLGLHDIPVFGSSEFTLLPVGVVEMPSRITRLNLIFPLGHMYDHDIISKGACYDEFVIRLLVSRTHTMS